MNPSDVIKLLPDKWRLALYATYAALGATLVATQVGYAAADAGQPLWLTVAWPVFGSLGTSFGLIAANHVTRDKTPPSDTSSTPTTFDAPTVRPSSVGQPVQRALTKHGKRYGATLVAMLLVAAGLTVTTTSATPRIASAGTLCNIIGSCGKVSNEKGSKGSIVVSNSWSASKKRLAGKTCVLSPGQTSAKKCGDAFRDTDGVRIPKGLKGKLKLKNGKGGVRYRTLSPGDHKVRDYEHWTLRIVKA